MVSVLIVEAHPVVRMGIRSALQEGPGFFIVGEADDVDQLMAVAVAAPVRAQVIVINLDLICGMSRAARAAFRIEFPGARLLAHSDLRDIGPWVDFIAAETDGCLSWNCSSSEFRIAISTLANGQPYIGELLAKALVQAFFRAGSISCSDLSPKEMKVYKMLAIGIDATGIAAQLDISTRTVSSLKARIIAAMGRSGARDLTSFALDRGFI